MMSMSERCVLSAWIMAAVWGCQAPRATAPAKNPAAAAAATPSPELAPAQAATPSPELAHAQARDHVSTGVRRAHDALPVSLHQGVFIYQAFNEAWHIHGGDAAWVYAMTLKLSSARGPLTIKLESLALLTGHCAHKEWSGRKPLALTQLARLAREDGSGAHVYAGAAPWRVELEPAQVESLSVGHEPVSVYNACDRFAYEVGLSVDGARAVVEVPLGVVREEPYPEEFMP